ncbi:MAG: LysR substrate-binding domain-containing protein [Tistlia sp.]|uniref:LysR family transcriptional regulator n=1 Tax=Tistlia sp. TaxID=3057121 RepID=UPI0034A46373
MINLLQVRAFLTVLEAGGLRPAARRLALSPSTLLEQLRGLERELGSVLLRRGGAPRPTAAGERFLPLAHALLDTAERAQRLLRSLPLRLAAASNIGVYLLQPALADWQDGAGGQAGEGGAEPGRETELWIGSNPEAAARLESGQADLALLEWWDGRPGFRACSWRREPLCLIAAPHHRLARRESVPLEELAGEVLFGGERGTGTGTLLRRQLGEGAGALGAIDGLGSTEAVKRAVRSGRGLSLVLRGAVEEEVAAGSLVALSLDGLDLAKDLQIVLPERLPPTAPAARFRDFLLAREGADAALPVEALSPPAALP